MPRKSQTAAAAKVATPKGSAPGGRARVATAKQQKIADEAAQKKAAATQRAYTAALREEQRREEAMGFTSQRAVHNRSQDDDEDFAPESEEEPTTEDVMFKRVELAPIIKCTQAPQPENHRTEVPVEKPRPKLVRRIPQAASASPVLMMRDNNVQATASPHNTDTFTRNVGPFTPRVQSYYRGVDGKFYSDVHTDARVYDEEDEFGNLPGQVYEELTKWFYPDAHPDLQAFPHSSLSTPKADPPVPQSSLGKRSTPPATMSAEATVTIKQIKTEPSGSRGRLRTSDLGSKIKSITEDAIAIFKVKLIMQNAFPERTEENGFAMEAFAEAAHKHGVSMDPDEDVIKMIQQRASQIRGDGKTITRPLVPVHFDIGSEVSARNNRNRAEDLLNRASFVYKDPENRTGIYQNGIIQKCINAMWFKNKNDIGASPAFLEGGIPVPAIALTFTLIECCLDEWQTGEHVNIQFQATAYREKYKSHLQSLQDFEVKTRDADIMSKLRLRLAKAAKKHAKIVDLAPARALAFEDADLEAAKKDWEELEDESDNE